MSAALRPDGRTQTRLDALRWIEALPKASFCMGDGMGCHSMYPLPGSTPPSLASPPNPTLSAFSSLAPSAGGANYFPNYQGYNTIYPYPPAGFIPPIENPAPSINAANFQVPRHYSYDMPVGTATSTSTTAVLPSKDTNHLGQPFQFTFQYPLPTQPGAAPFQDQRQGQYHVQVAQEDLAVEEPLREPEEPHSEDSQTSQESRAPPIEPENTTTHHICVNNPTAICTGRGPFCLDILCPDARTSEQVAEFFIAIIDSLESNAEQSADLFSQVDGDPRPSQHGHASWEMASSGSSTTTPAPTSECSSSSGSSFFYPPNHFETVASTDTVGSLTGKQKRSEDCTEDRPKKHRLEEDTHEDHHEPYNNNNNRSLDDREWRRKKKKRSIDGEYFCIICEIFNTPCLPLSRKDALKRHIQQLHEIFAILLTVDYKDFKVLEPRRMNEFEDLRPLIVLGITLQSKARKGGVKIEKEEDLRELYPHISRSLNYS
ncbi:hypothetical protein HD554DRAFT_861574 [Boletus coccyginus]|nr:hypothetical protein HD554DRAFT_861574 [Boletus coccyginus]